MDEVWNCVQWGRVVRMKGMILFTSLSINAPMREKSMSLSYFTFSAVFDLQLEATVLHFGDMSKKRGCFQEQDPNNYF